ncbi:MAG: hypothetical protein NVS1B7_4170 [Candidatus Saccharimonadales bacterium]
MRAKFEYAEAVNDSATMYMYWFKPERPVRYSPGQYIQVHIPHAQADKRGDKRWFTLTSIPSDDRISITTKIMFNHGSTFKQALHSLKLGDEINFTEPMGDFVLPRDETIRIVFVASGTGITPVYSMIKSLNDIKHNRHVNLFYTARNAKDLAFVQTIDSTSWLTTQLYAGEAPVDWHGTIGQLDVAKVTKIAQRENSSLIYASGPEKFVERIAQVLLLHDIDPSRQVLDFFSGYNDTGM